MAVHFCGAMPHLTKPEGRVGPIGDGQYGMLLSRSFESGPSASRSDNEGKAHKIGGRVFAGGCCVLTRRQGRCHRAPFYICPAGALVSCRALRGKLGWAGASPTPALQIPELIETRVGQARGHLECTSFQEPKTRRSRIYIRSGQVRSGLLLGRSLGP